MKTANWTGLCLLHENEKEIYGDTPQRCHDIIVTMNSEYVKAIFDPANFVQCDVETYPEAYRLLEKHIAYMHIKDALYRYHSVVPSGMGDGRVKDILTVLKGKKHDIFLSLEPHLGNFVGFRDLEPGSDTSNIPEGGPRQFAIAANALKKILDEIGAM